MDVVDINPLIPIAATAAAYGLAVLARKHGQTILFGLVAVWLLAFNVFGGDALRAVQQMPSAQGKVFCLARVIAGGAPINRDAGVESSVCRYQGEGMERGDPGEVRKMIRANSRLSR